MDYKVGTADGQSDGLLVLGVWEPWPIYLEGMEESIVLKRGQTVGLVAPCILTQEEQG